MSVVSNKTKVPYSDFFIPPSSSADPLIFTPHRKYDAYDLSFLVDGVKTLKAMEEAIFHAKKSIYLSFWRFDNKTRLQSKQFDKYQTLNTFGDLLTWKATDGVKIYLLMTDFDPIFQTQFHSTNWRTYWSCYRQHIRDLFPEHRNNFQVMCMMHSAKTFFSSLSSSGQDLIQSLLKNKLLEHVATLNKNLAIENDNRRKKKKNYKSALLDYLYAPGLWDFIKIKKKGEKYSCVLKPEIKYSLYPAVHHQKYCIIDNEQVICGGLDVLDNRVDNRRHSLYPAGRAWHDVNCMFKGSTAQDAAQSFIVRWNNHIKDFEEFIKNRNSLSRGFKLPYLPLTRITNSYSDRKKDLNKKPSSIVTQVLRTHSIDNNNYKVPKNQMRDILKSYEKAIKNAQEYIYIENQYVRYPPLVDWIVQRHSQISTLKVIILVPDEPEEAIGKRLPDPITAKGRILQGEIFQNLLSALGPNTVGFYSLKNKKEEALGTKQKRGRFRGAAPPDNYSIYAHSKLMIIDDRFIHIGTPNISPRSFLMDGEMSFAIYSSRHAKALRYNLWQEYFGRPNKTILSIPRWKPDKFIDMWNLLAKKEDSFVINHNLDKYNKSIAAQALDLISYSNIPFEYL